MRTTRTTRNGQQLAIGLAALLLGASAAAQGAGAGAGASASGDAGAGKGEEAGLRVEQARQAFVLGATLAAQQQWADALNAFERSSRLRSHPVTTYNLAYCERALGHYTRSYKLFRESLSEHETQKAGVLPDDLLGLAKAYVPELERRVARVHVRLAPDLAAVAVDGRPLESSGAAGATPVVLTAGTSDRVGSEVPAAARFDLMIDPGRHVFVVSRPGEPDRVVVEAFGEGETRDLVLDTSRRQRAQADRARGPERLAPRNDVPALAAFGAGGAGLIIGGIFGIAAVRKKGYLDDHCSSPGACGPRYQDDIDTLKRDALVADIGFGVAVVGAGLGTYLLLTGGSGEETRQGGASPPRVEAFVGPRGFGARGSF